MNKPSKKFIIEFAPVTTDGIFQVYIQNAWTYTFHKAAFTKLEAQRIAEFCDSYLGAKVYNTQTGKWLAPAKRTAVV